jgi:hypothetical protein
VFIPVSCEPLQSSFFRFNSFVTNLIIARREKILKKRLWSRKPTWRGEKTAASAFLSRASYHTRGFFFLLDFVFSQLQDTMFHRGKRPLPVYRGINGYNTCKCKIYVRKCSAILLGRLRSVMSQPESLHNSCLPRVFIFVKKVLASSSSPLLELSCEKGREQMRLTSRVHVAESYKSSEKLLCWSEIYDLSLCLR